MQALNRLSTLFQGKKSRDSSTGTLDLMPLIFHYPTNRWAHLGGSRWLQESKEKRRAEASRRCHPRYGVAVLPAGQVHSLGGFHSHGGRATPGKTDEKSLGGRQEGHPHPQAGREPQSLTSRARSGGAFPGHRAGRRHSPGSAPRPPPLRSRQPSRPGGAAGPGPRTAGARAPPPER